MVAFFHVSGGVMRKCLLIWVFINLFFFYGKASNESERQEKLRIEAENKIKNLFERKSYQLIQTELEEYKKLFGKGLIGQYQGHIFEGKLANEMQDFLSALKNYNQAYLKAKALNNNRLTVQALVLNGEMFRKINDHAMAEEAFQSALKWCPTTGKENATKALVLNALGSLHYSVLKYNSALDYYKSALQLFQKTTKKEDRYYIQNVLDNIGLCYFKLDSFSKASRFYLAAIEESNQTGNKMGASVAFVNYGKLLLQIGNYDSSESIFRKSILVADKNNNHYFSQLVHVYIEFAGLFYKKNQLDSMFFYLQKSNTIMQRNDDFEFFDNYTLGMINYYQAMRNYEKANHFLGNYLSSIKEKNEKRDRILYSNELRSLNLHRIQADFELEIKNREIKELESKYLAFIYIIAGLIIAFLLFFLYKFRKDAIKSQILTEKINNQYHILEQAHDALEKSNEQKDYILATVAHDLRGPIGGILMAAGTLQRTKIDFPEQEKELLGIIEHTAKYSLGIVKDLLDSKILDDKELVLPKQPILFLPYLKACCETIGYLSRNKNIFIDIQVSEDLVVLINAETFSRALENVLSNAIKFSHSNSRIKVIASQSPSHTEIMVEDFGIGINPDMKEQIFMPYNKGTKGTQGEKSIGLGLSITRKIVVLHGGKIWVDSVLGKGSRFHIEIPA